MRSKAEEESSINTLKQNLKPGDTVFTILRHVSRSGMSRSITPIVIREGKPLSLTYDVARALGHSECRGFVDCVQCRGCGMDMGFALVNRLSLILFGDGYALKHRWL